MRKMFELFTGADGQTYWRLKAGNGEIIAISEGYSSMQAAETGIASVRENAGGEVVDLRS